MMIILWLLSLVCFNPTKPQIFTELQNSMIVQYESCMAIETEIEPVISKEEELELFALETIPEDHLQVLYNIVEAEATGGSVDSKYNVACVILNRVNDYEFPDNITDVVFQKRQFAPITDGRYSTLEISQSTKDGVHKAIYDANHNSMPDLHSKALYFCNYDMIKSPKTQRWFVNELELLFKDDVGNTFFGRKE